jgi:hypothetical protein
MLIGVPWAIPTGAMFGVISFVFILLQSACTAVMALSGVRLLIGVTYLAAASIIPGFIFTIHARWIRIPMMTFAVLGSVVNLSPLRMRRASAFEWNNARSLLMAASLSFPANALPRHLYWKTCTRVGKTLLSQSTWINSGPNWECATVPKDSNSIRTLFSHASGVS